MKVFEVGSPQRFFVQQYAYKSNESSLGLGEKHVTAVRIWR
jgi:hypothetical protein